MKVLKVVSCCGYVLLTNLLLDAAQKKKKKQTTKQLFRILVEHIILLEMFVA